MNISPNFQTRSTWDLRLVVGEDQSQFPDPIVLRLRTCSRWRSVPIPGPDRNRFRLPTLRRRGRHWTGFHLRTLRRRGCLWTCFQLRTLRRRIFFFFKLGLGPVLLMRRKLTWAFLWSSSLTDIYRAVYILMLSLHQNVKFDVKSMSFIVTLQVGLIFSSHKDAPYWKIQ